MHSAEPGPSAGPSRFTLALPATGTGTGTLPACNRYEPELFPGLIYRMKQPKIVLLIFVSGKVVLTGGKVRQEIFTAFEQIYPVLQEFRKVAAPAS